jgi:hypothetical protein
MKLEVFNQKTLPKSRGGQSSIRAKISFCKTGIVSLNKKACELLELDHGDGVSIAQDQTDPANWYIYKDDKDGYILRHPDKPSFHLVCHNRKLVNTIIEHFELDLKQTYSFQISHQVTEDKNLKLYGILFGIS